MAKFQRHVFTCIHDRGPDHPRGSCAQKGSMEVAELMKSKLHERGLKRVVRANKAGCLDQCARGVTLVVYPDAVWYGGVTTADVDEIIERHIVGGQPVERLVIRDADLTGVEPPSGTQLGRES
jgi:(2Fe-2S) ferredoxin